MQILYQNKFSNYLYWILRLYLGVVITAAAVGKLLDLKGFVGVIETYQMHLASPTLGPIAISIIAFEFLLGLWLLFGSNIKIAAILSIIMHFGYFLLLKDGQAKYLLPKIGY